MRGLSRPIPERRDSASTGFRRSAGKGGPRCAQAPVALLAVPGNGAASERSLSFEAAAALVRQCPGTFQVFALLAADATAEDLLQAEIALVLFGFAGICLNLAGTTTPAGSQQAVALVQRVGDLCTRHRKLLRFASDPDLC